MLYVFGVAAWLEQRIIFAAPFYLSFRGVIVMNRNLFIIATVALLVVAAFFSIPAGRTNAITDENDLISDDGAVIGGATGNGSYMNVYCMWKVSVYVGKSDTLAHSSAEQNFDERLRSQSLSRDYYKFGNSFYLYKDSGRGAGLAAANYDSSRFFLTVRDKQWYRDHFEEYRSGAMEASEYFKQGTYSDLSSICFNGQDYGLTGANEVPDVPNFGGNASAAYAFFTGAETSNKLIQIAADACGGTVEGILSELSFTLNGATKTGAEWGLAMVSAIRGNDMLHTSCVPWVFEYEPVVTVQLRSGYAMALTATEISVAMITGRYNFTSNAENVEVLFRSGEQDLKAKVSGEFLSMGLAALFQNLPSSVYTSKGWLGIENLDSFPKIESYGATAARYVTDQLKAGGVGLRYQVSEAPLVSLTKTVKVDGVEDGNCSKEGFVFVISPVSGGETFTVVTDSEGRANLRLRPGTYLISEQNSGLGYRTGAVRIGNALLAPDANGMYRFTVPDTGSEISVENTVFTGELDILKYAEGGDYSVTFFEISGKDSANGNVKFTVDAGGGFVEDAVYYAMGSTGLKRIEIGFNTVRPAFVTVVKDDVTEASQRAVRRLRITGLPEGTWQVKEILAGDLTRFSATYAGEDYSAPSDNLTVVVTRQPGVATARFDNVKTLKTVLKIRKIATGNDFSDTFFELSATVSGMRLKFFVTPDGSVADDGTAVSGTREGDVTLDRMNFGLLEGQLEIEHSLTGGEAGTVNTVEVKGLPAGEWTVREITGNCQRFDKTEVTAGGVTEEAFTTCVSIAPGNEASILFVNTRHPRLTVRFFDKYLYAQGEKMQIKDPVTFVLEKGAEYDHTDILTENSQIATQSIDYYYTKEGMSVGNVYGAALAGTAGEDDIETDVTYGYFHTITVVYRDKYSGAELHREVISTEHSS